MSARNFAPTRALNRDVVIIAGSFAPNGSSAISASSRKGKGFTVARTSAGLFTITLTEKYANLLSATATVQHPTAVDLKAQVGVYDASARTITITTLAVATATDVTADADARVNFVLVFQNGNQGVRG